jgi:putative transposase
MLAEATSVADVSKKNRVSRETIYTWRRKFAGVDVKEAKRLRELERENGRLKKALVERDLEIEVMKEIAAKIGERAGTQTAGRIRREARRFMPARMFLAERRSFGTNVRVSSRRARPRAARVPAGVGPRISTMGLSPRAGDAGKERFHDEHEEGASVVEEGRVAGPPQVPATSRGFLSSSAATGERCEPGVGVRLCLRRLRKRTEAQVPDGHPRVNAGSAGDRCGWPTALASGD